MYLEALLLGLGIGFLRNGSIQNFMSAKFRGWFLMPIAFIVFLGPYWIGFFNVEQLNLSVFPFAAMVICFLILLMNFKKSGIKLISLGALLNLIVMGLNQFKMPIVTVVSETSSMNPFLESVKQGTIINYFDGVGGHQISALLGKVIFLPEGYPLVCALSIGDILISIGVVILIQSEMQYHVTKLRGNMVNFAYKSRGRN